MLRTMFSVAKGTLTGISAVVIYCLFTIWVLLWLWIFGQVVVYIVVTLVSLLTKTPLGSAHSYVSYKQRIEKEEKAAKQQAKLDEESSKREAEEAAVRAQYDEAVGDILNDENFQDYRQYFLKSKRNKIHIMQEEMHAARLYKALGKISIKELVESQENMQKLANLDSESEAVKQFFVEWAKRRVMYNDKTGKYRSSAFAPIDAKTTSDKPGENGEAAVDYTLKWWIKEHGGIVISKDCKSKYSDHCIMLQAESENEPQEFDHIVVTHGGVVHIETKDYAGEIEIIDEDTWKRRLANGSEETMRSPASQVRRHQHVIRQIVPESYEVFPLICLSNEKTTYTGSENCSIPVVNIRTLESVLNSIDQKQTITDKEAELLTSLINSHKKKG